jgi:hypothetical protein
MKRDSLTNYLAPLLNFDTASCDTRVDTELDSWTQLLLRRRTTTSSKQLTRTAGSSVRRHSGILILKTIEDVRLMSLNACKS